jgi:hypothetical protein
MELGEAAGGFHVGPFDEDGMGGGEVRFVGKVFGAFVLEQAGEEEQIGLGLALGDGGFVAEVDDLLFGRRRSGGLVPCHATGALIFRRGRVEESRLVDGRDWGLVRSLHELAGEGQRG